MKIFFFFLAISLFSLNSIAQSTLASNTTTNNKQIANATTSVTEDVLVLKETAFDFGKIPQGKPVTHIFEITNNGKDSLRIVNIQASCGCTTPEWDHTKVPAPGEKMNITVGYNAASEGPFTKPITITYNGTQTKLINIKGEVWKTPATSAPENKTINNLKD